MNSFLFTLRLMFLLPFRPALASEVKSLPRGAWVGLLVFCVLWLGLDMALLATHLRPSPDLLLDTATRVLPLPLVAVVRDVVLFPWWSRLLGLPVDRHRLIRLLALRMAFLVLVLALVQMAENLMLYGNRGQGEPTTVALARLAEGGMAVTLMHLDTLRGAVKVWLGVMGVWHLAVLTGRTFWRVLLVVLPYVMLLVLLGWGLNRVLHGFWVPPVGF